MTKMIEHTLNLPSMDELLIDQDSTDEFESDEANQASLETAVAMADMAGQHLAIQDGDGHSEAMDTIHKETLKHARDLVDLGYNVDQRSAATIFEKATMMYKVAQDAKDSKRKMQLEAMKLMQNMRKLELDEMKLRHEMGDRADIETEATIVEDRNELIKRMRDQAKKAKEEASPEE
jgi:hypothetical protein